MNSLSGGTTLLGGYTRLCKGLAVVLIAAHLLLRIFPVSLTYLSLIPARTIPFAWNLVTAGYVEQTIYGLAVSTVSLLLMGKFLEPVWGSREFLKFIFVVNLFTSLCVFVTAIIFYYTTTEEMYLYMPLSGFHGVLSGFLVGIKQIVSDQELPFLKFKATWLPSIVLLLAGISSFFISEPAKYLPTLFFGTYTGWIYLRYWQKKPETKFRGDPSDEFSFSSFFPEFLRPIIDPVAMIFGRLLCGKCETRPESDDYDMRDNPFPGSDSIEASRRRERGARALEERLAADRLAAVRSSEQSRRDATENV